MDSPTRQPDRPAREMAFAADETIEVAPPAATEGKPAPNPHRRARRRAVGAVAGSLLLLVGGAVTVNVLIVARSAGFVVSPVDAPPGQVAIVLGARVVRGDHPSPMLADRLETGLELYHLGKVKKLLLSGDHGTIPYDEVNVMRTYVMERGVPAEDVFMDHAGFSTYETMYRARDVFLVTDALVVTQDFHLARAVYTARTLGLKATGVSADRRPYAHTARLVVREWLARCKAFVQLHVLHSRPRFLGGEIPITGDGRATEG